MTILTLWFNQKSSHYIYLEIIPFLGRRGSRAGREFALHMTGQGSDLSIPYDTLNSSRSDHWPLLVVIQN